MRSLAKAIIGIEEDVVKFEKWAFGDDCRELKLEDVCSRWNEIHGDKLTLEKDGYISDDIRKMIKLWKKETKCKSIPA